MKKQEKEQLIKNLKKVAISLLTYLMGIALFIIIFIILIGKMLSPTNSKTARRIFNMISGGEI